MPRGALSVVAALVVAVALAGCSTTSPTVAPAASDRAGQPLDTYQSRGTELRVDFAGAPLLPGPCRVDYTATASETADRVYVRVTPVRRAPHAAQLGCPRVTGPRAVVLRLQQPLGPRAVVDGSTGDMLIQPTS
ncbi:hypothetical protein [Knoellia koreensis]|uniref:Lipoprotein n=1 Tax=Knoellia koreensis TaxID=2730921 RepID=A0A849HE99_9MICO|nr:hypothetical protein [Knoellia sp. DB2414S]NNM45449.1 hypothetical protein [Knoellia sp. DB2414S]